MLSGKPVPEGQWIKPPSQPGPGEIQLEQKLNGAVNANGLIDFANFNSNEFDIPESGVWDKLQHRNKSSKFPLDIQNLENINLQEFETPISGKWNATTILKLANIAKKNGPKTTDLQKILENLSSQDFSPPSNGPWNIKESVTSIAITPSTATIQTVTVKSTDLQNLIEKVQQEESSTLATPILKPSRVPKIENSFKSATIRTSELQELLSLHGLNNNVPSNVWNIRNSVTTAPSVDSVTIRNAEISIIHQTTPQPLIKASALQQLLQNHGLKSNKPESPWDIRSSAQKFRQKYKQNTTPSPAAQITISDLQNLFESHGFHPPKPNEAWNIRTSAEKFRQSLRTTTPSPLPQITVSDLQKLFESHGLNTQTPNNAWDIRESANQQKKLQVADLARAPEQVTVRTTELQNLLRDHGLLEEGPAQAWNIRQSAEKLRNQKNKNKLENGKTELQKLLEQYGLVKNIPEETWNIRESAKQQALKTQKPEVSQLQQLLQQYGLSDNGQPETPWNIRESSLAFKSALEQQQISQNPKSPASNELQSLLEQFGIQDQSTPASVWNIGKEVTSKTVQKDGSKIVSTELQDLFEKFGVQEHTTPATPWDIREGSVRFGNTEPEAQLFDDIQITLKQIEELNKPESVTVRTNDLQSLLTGLNSEEFSVPQSGAWNNQKKLNDPKFTNQLPIEELKSPETVTIRTTDLQSLFTGLNGDEFSEPQSGGWDKLKHIKKKPFQVDELRSPETVTIRTTELQSLFSGLNSEEFSEPQSGGWDKLKHINKKPFQIDEVESPETVTIRTTALQSLFSGLNIDEFSEPQSGGWDKLKHLNKKPNPQLSDISSEKDEIDLQSVISTTAVPTQLSNLDVIKITNLKTQVSSLREKQEENMANKDRLEVHDFKLLNKLIIKENQLQQLLNNLDTSEFDAPVQGVWNIREAAEKFKLAQRQKTTF